MKIIYFIFGILLTYFLIEVKNKCFIKNDSKEQLNNIIRKLTRQAARWSTAAKQDKSPLIAVLHSNYGAGYLWALKDIATTEEIESATGIDYLKFEAQIVKAMDAASKKALNVCPKFGPERSYLTKLGGE